MVEFWDRTTLSIKRPRTPSERSDEDHMQHPPSGKKGKGKGKIVKECAQIVCFVFTVLCVVVYVVLHADTLSFCEFVILILID